MDVQLQELIDKIKKDGVASAQVEAAKIIDDAEKKAAEIVSDAQVKAADIVKNAKKETERVAAKEKKTNEQKKVVTYIEKIVDFFAENKTNVAVIKPVLEKCKELGFDNPKSIDNIDDAKTLLDFIDSIE